MAFAGKVSRSTHIANRLESAQLKGWAFMGTFRILWFHGGVEGSAPSYPPYNIARTGENDYRISVAVAGFTEADLAIEAKENTLTLLGARSSRPTTRRKSGDVLYQGIAARNFERSFQPPTMCRSGVRA